MLIKFDWIWCAAYLFTRTLQTVQFGWLPELQRPRRNLGKRCCNKRRSPDAKNLVIMHNLDLINQARARRSSTTESTFHLSAALCPFLSDFMRSHELQLFSISRWWVLLWMGFGILCRTGLWQWPPSGPINLLLTHCAWVPRRSCSLFMFNSFLLNTNASFISIPLFGFDLHTAFLSESEWTTGMEETVRSDGWCNTTHHDTFFIILPCSFMFFLQVRFGYKQSWAVSEFSWTFFCACQNWFEDVSWYSCHFMSALLVCRKMQQMSRSSCPASVGTFWNMDTTQDTQGIMNYHDKTMQCGHPGGKRRNVRAAFTSSLACEYDCICRYCRYLWSKDIESVVQSPRFSDSAKMN